VTQNRKVIILDSGVFPILKIENFLSDADYQTVKKEVKDEVIKLEKMIKSGMRDDPVGTSGGRYFNRVYLDSLYKEDRKKSKTLTIVQQNLFSNEMLDIYDSVPETAYQLLKDSTNHETAITVYKDKSAYSWHHDVVGRRVVNYVLMIDLGMKFEGGHTQTSNYLWNPMDERTLFDGGLDLDAELDIEPKGNQLIVMPMWVTHRVTPVKMKSKNMLDGRITVNGHIGFKPNPKEDQGLSKARPNELEQHMY